MRTSFTLGGARMGMPRIMLIALLALGIAACASGTSLAPVGERDAGGDNLYGGGEPPVGEGAGAAVPSAAPSQGRGRCRRSRR